MARCLPVGTRSWSLFCALWLMLLLPLSAVAAAQTSDPSGGAERSAWYMYFGDHPVSQNYDVHLEGQYRREGIGQRWEQLLIRPGVQRDLGHGMSALLAYTYLRDYPQEGASLGDPATGPQPEHRILEEFALKQKLTAHGRPAVDLGHRLRAEQRFEGTSIAHRGTVYWQYAERARYRLTANILLPKQDGTAWPSYVSVYNEVFVNFGPHGGNHAFNQDRTYGALGWNLNQYYQLEVGYLYQYSPTPNGVVGEHNQALQVTINSTLPLSGPRRHSRSR